MLQQIQPVVEVKNPVADQVIVMTLGYFYAVDLGELICPRHHRVAINGECTCILRRECPAVKAVRITWQKAVNAQNFHPMGIIQ